MRRKRWMGLKWAEFSSEINPLKMLGGKNSWEKEPVTKERTEIKLNYLLLLYLGTVKCKCTKKNR